MLNKFKKNSHYYSVQQQALEREQEREEFMNKINRMEEFVKEKERIQSSESQMAREVNYGSFFFNN